MWVHWESKQVHPVQYCNKWPQNHHWTRITTHTRTVSLVVEAHLRYRDTMRQLYSLPLCRNSTVWSLLYVVPPGNTYLSKEAKEYYAVMVKYMFLAWSYLLICQYFFETGKTRKCCSISSKKALAKKIQKLHLRIVYFSNKNHCNRINTDGCSQSEKLKSNHE